VAGTPVKRVHYECFKFLKRWMVSVISALLELRVLIETDFSDQPPLCRTWYKCIYGDIFTDYTDTASLDRIVCKWRSLVKRHI